MRFVLEFCRQFVCYPHANAEDELAEQVENIYSLALIWDKKS